MATPDLNELLQLAWPTHWLAVALVLGAIIYFAINEIGENANWTGLQPLAVQLVLVLFISLAYFAFGGGFHVAAAAFVWMIVFPRLVKWSFIGIGATVAWAWEFLGNQGRNQGQ